MSYKSGMSFKDIQTVTGTINLSSIYSTVLADASGGAVVLNLPAASAQAEIIFRIKAVDVTNSITITPSGVETIDGVAGSITMSTLNEIVTLQSTGSQWVSLENSFAKDNIYTADGTLTGDRTVTMGGNDIIFNGGQLLTDLGDYQNPSYSFENNRGSGLYSFGSNGVALTADSSYVLGFIHSSGVNTATIYGSGNNSVGAANLTITENSTALGSSENVRTSMFWSGGVFNIEAWESGVGYDKNISLNGLGGNVGIGTATPSSSLHVVGSTIFTSEDVLTIESNPNGTGEYIGMVFKNTDKDTNAAIRSVVGGNTDDADLAFIVDYQGTPFEGMRILGDSGHVGIGTTSPAYKLDVNGNARITGAIYDSNNQAGTSGQILSSTAIGTDWIDAISSADITGTANYLGMFDSDGVGLVDSLLFVEGSYLKYDSNFIIGQNNSTDATNKSSRWGVAHYTNSEKPILGIMGTCTGSSSYVYIGGGSSIGNAATAITFFTAATNTTNTGTQRMIINKDGDVGIGTGAPIAKTHIVGDGNSGTSRAMLIHNSDNDTILDVKDNGSFIVGAGGESDTAEGFWTRPDGRTSIVRDDNDTLILTRNTSDGNVISFRRDGGDVGAIGITTGGLTIGTPSSTAIETTSQNVKLTAYGLGTKEAADLTKTSSGYGAVFATDGTILEELGGASLANEGLSKDTTTGNIQLGHAASGTGASDFTANRYLYTDTFDLRVDTDANIDALVVNGSTGHVGINGGSLGNNVFSVIGEGNFKTIFANTTGTNSAIEGNSSSSGPAGQFISTGNGATLIVQSSGNSDGAQIRKTHAITGKLALNVFNENSLGGYHERNNIMALTGYGSGANTAAVNTTQFPISLRAGTSTGATEEFARMTYEIVDNVSATKDSALHFWTANGAGSIVDRLVLDGAGTLQGTAYGLGTKEAADLTKTDSGYLAGFATDGTIIEVAKATDYQPDTQIIYGTGLTTAPSSSANFTYDGAIVNLHAVVGEKLRVFDGGVGVHYGFGINGGNFNTYFPTGASFTFNHGGGFQAEGVNELFKIETGGGVGLTDQYIASAIYGSGNKDAGTLSKTSSGYIAEFATDGTILETTLSSVPLTLETITAATASLTKDNTLLDATSNAVDLQPNPANMTVGQRYIVKAINTTNAVTITPTSGTIDGQASYTLPAQYDGVIMITDGTNIYLA